MNIFKKFLSLFKKDKLPKHIKHTKTKSKGQELIYWNNYLNRKNLTKVLIPLFSLFLLSTILIVVIKPITEVQIYNNNFEYEVYGITRGSNRNIIEYNLLIGKFDTAFTLLNIELEKDSVNNLYRYYMSVVSMKLDKHSISQKYLKEIYDDGDNLFVDDAQWLLALSYLKTDKGKSIIEFRKISHNDNHYKQENAKEILNELE